MIIFWQHFFIVIVEASSSPYSPSSPHVSSFSTLFIRAHVCEKLLGCPYCTLCPCLTVHNFVFLHKGTPAVSARQKYNCSFHRLEIKSCYSIGSPYMFFVRFIYTLFMQVHYRLLITNQSHPIRQQNTIVMFDKNYLFLNQSFHEVYKWTALPPFPWKTYYK